MDERIENWPRGMQEISDAIGPEATLKLVAHLGGVAKQYIPMTARADHPLVAVIGFEPLQSLCRKFGGGHIEIPRGTFRQNKKAQIMESDGSARDTALKVECSERYVRRVRSAVAAPIGPLFKDL